MPNSCGKFAQAVTSNNNPTRSVVRITANIRNEKPGSKKKVYYSGFSTRTRRRTQTTTTTTSPVTSEEGDDSEKSALLKGTDYEANKLSDYVQASSAHEASHLPVITFNPALIQKEEPPQSASSSSFDDFQSHAAALQEAEMAAAAEKVADESGKQWMRLKKLSSFQRTLEIWGFVFKFLFKRWAVDKKWSYKKAQMTSEGAISPEAKSAKLAVLAIWLRENLIKLGPTFIKCGQQFSTRVDVLAPELVQELAKLQDNVPAFGIQEAKDIIQEELGGPVEEKFSFFQDVPIAAASLGQVHLAEMEGQRIVVKVQRPGLKKLFDVDLKNIRVLASILQAVDPKTDGTKRDWVAIYDECAKVLYQEIDYRQEGKNADDFRENFQKAGLDWCKVPDIYWNYSSERVLTMEYCPGIKISLVDELEAAGLDTARLARLSVESYLLQIMRFGLFHADPHPGNIAVDPKTAQLIYYDFGMMGRLKPTVKEGVLKLFYGVFGRDPDMAVEALLLMGILVPDSDMTSVRRTANFFLNSMSNRLETQEAEAQQQGEEYSKEYRKQKSKDEKQARRKQIFSNIGEDLLMMGKDQPFRFPATFTFVVRAFTVLDGVGKALDKKFDMSEIARPYARDLLLEGEPQSARIRKAVVKRATQQTRALVNLIKGPDRVEELDDVVRRLQNGDLKLRVRALEAERAMARMAIMQNAQSSGMLAATAANIGTVLFVSNIFTAATVAFTATGLFSILALASLLKVSKLNKKELQYTGA